MKKIVTSAIKVSFIGLAIYLSMIHLMHDAALGGYLDGCKDVIKEGQEQEGLELPNGVVESYCHSLLARYEKKK